MAWAVVVGSAEAAAGWPARTQNLVHERLDELGERVFADPAQQQAGDGYAELRARDEARRVELGALSQPRRAVPRRRELVDPRPAR